MFTKEAGTVAACTTVEPAILYGFQFLLSFSEPTSRYYLIATDKAWRFSQKRAVCNRFVCESLAPDWRFGCTHHVGIEGHDDDG